MSLAAGIVPRVEGQHDNGPAAGEAACTQTVHGGHGRARVQRRTGEEGDVAGPKSIFLEVLGELRRPVWWLLSEHKRTLDLRTESEQPANADMINDGIIAWFEALHRPSWSSRHHPDRSRPEMLQLAM